MREKQDVANPRGGRYCLQEAIFFEDIHTQPSSGFLSELQGRYKPCEMNYIITMFWKNVILGASQPCTSNFLKYVRLVNYFRKLSGPSIPEPVLLKTAEPGQLRSNSSCSTRFLFYFIFVFFFFSLNRAV